MRLKFPVPSASSTESLPPSRSLSVRNAVLRSLGIIVSVVTMHFLVVRPLVVRLNGLHELLVRADENFGTVQRIREVSRRNAELMSLLKSGQQQTADARATFEQLQSLRSELEQVTSRLPVQQAESVTLAQLPGLSSESGRATSRLSAQSLSSSTGTAQRPLQIPVPEPYGFAAPSIKPQLAVSSPEELAVQQSLRRPVAEIAQWEDRWKMIVRPFPGNRDSHTPGASVPATATHAQPIVTSESGRLSATRR